MEDSPTTKRDSPATALRARYDSGDPGALDAIKREAEKYRFYHSIELVPGLRTAGLSAQGYDWADRVVDRFLEAMRSIDFKGRRVLDIGCRDGAFSFAAEGLGAAEVIGIDNDLSRGLTEFLIPFRRSRVRATQLNVNDLTPDLFGRFDVVLFAGVLYHLRYPMWALRRIAEVLKPGGTMLIESAFIDGFGDFPIMFCPTDDGQPYEASCVTFFNEAGLAATLRSLGLSDVRSIDSYLYAGRRRVLPLFARAFPHFMRRFWWAAPRVCRKIFVCKKQWAQSAIAAGYPQIASYWDQRHRWHSGE